MGERWRIALEIVIAAVGEGGLLVIPQEAWEGLDPQNREAIAQQAKSARVVILTAECADSELSAEMV
jgi:L-lactate utilization protein LutC